MKKVVAERIPYLQFGRLKLFSPAVLNRLVETGNAAAKGSEND